MRRRGLTLMLLIVLVLALSVPALASPATNTTGNNKVDWLIEKKIVIGDGSGDYKLKNNITRAEANKMLVESLEKRTEADNMKNTLPKFTDVKSSDWFVGYLNYAVSKNIINGYEDNTFKPQNDVTYEEMIKMLVVAHGGSTGKETTTGYWSTPYINKAREMGILDGVSIADYRKAAPRDKVFEMIYNAMHGNTFNSGLKKDEYYAVVVSVGENVYSSNNDNTRVLAAGEGSAYKVGSFLSMSSQVVNDKNALGKVYKVSADARGNAISATVANDIKIHEGPAELKDNSIQIAGLNLNIAKGYEGLSILTHNDKDYVYKDFVNQNSTRTSGYISEYARIYTKDNFVIYVESFAFEDIAPVQSAMAFGVSDIYIYDDTRSGDPQRITLRSLKGYEKGQQFTLKLEDLKMYDVLHIYDRDKALVSRGSKETGTFDGIESKRDAYFAKLGNKEFQVRISNSKRPIILETANRARVIEAERSTRYSEIERSKVDLILDLNGHVQLITGESSASNDVGIFSSDSTRDVNIIGMGILDASTRLEYRIGINGRGQRGDIREGDLVYVEKNGKEVMSISRLFTIREMDNQAARVATNFNDELLIQSNTIELVGGGRSNVFRYDNKTKVFAIQGDSNNPVKISAVDMRYAKSDAARNVRAFILTTDQYDRLLSGRFNEAGNSTGDMAHTIVFMDFGHHNAPISGNAYRLTRDFTPGDRGLYLQKSGFSSAQFYEFEDSRYSENLRAMREGTDIEISLNSRDEITRVSSIASTVPGRETFKVADIFLPVTIGVSTRDGHIKLTDRYGTDKTFTLNISNYSSARDITYNDVVTIDYSGNTLNEITGKYHSDTQITGSFR
ncbi:MAG: S-layer homology domain-containing protein [Tissierellia bacterium]|nr:S-layer homology domain-containing protein [Tissierellia bacterium]